MQKNESLRGFEITTYVWCTILALLAFSSHFLFVILSPLIFLDKLSLSLTDYGLVMLYYGAAYIAGGSLASFSTERITTINQVKLGLIVICTGGIVMLTLNSLAGMSVQTVIGCVIITTCGVCLTRPAATTLAMDAVPSRAGAAAAGINTAVFIGGGIVSFFLGIYSEAADILMPLALITMGSTGLIITKLCLPTFRP